MGCLIKQCFIYHHIEELYGMAMFCVSVLGLLLNKSLNLYSPCKYTISARRYDGCISSMQGMESVD